MKRRAIYLAAAMLAALLLFSCAALAEGQLPYRFAEKDEGAALLLGNGAYSDAFTQNDLDYRVQRKGATVEEYRAFAAGQVLDFTDAERSALRDGMAAIEAVLEENGYGLPELGEIVFVKTTQREEGGSGAYTLGNQIYLGESVLDCLRASEENLQLLGRSILCHEIFHCLTRHDPQFRSDMYAIIHFATHAQEFELSPELEALRYTNPDVGRRDASASFVIDGEERECFVALIAGEPFRQPGDSFMDSVEPVLVPADDPGAYFKPEDAANFWEVFGRNTSYVLDPEECLADNFGYALMCEETDPFGDPFPNPEILDAIRAHLAGGASGQLSPR